MSGHAPWRTVSGGWEQMGGGGTALRSSCVRCRHCVCPGLCETRVFGELHRRGHPSCLLLPLSVSQHQDSVSCVAAGVLPPMPTQILSVLQGRAPAFPKGVSSPSPPRMHPAFDSLSLSLSSCLHLPFLFSPPLAATSKLLFGTLRTFYAPSSLNAQYSTTPCATEGHLGGMAGAGALGMPCPDP